MKTRIITKSILFFLILFPDSLFGQETEKIIQDNNLGYKEIYYVLKSDRTILQGSYKKYGNDNSLWEEGFYKNGLKDSLWIEYNYGGYLKSKGHYKLHRKVGVWEFYGFKGELEQKYDFTKKEIVYFKQEDKEYLIIGGANTFLSKPEQPPLYIGGYNSIGSIIAENTRYPEEAIAGNISGTVFVSFSIDSLGKTSNYYVSKGIGGGCDEEALRVVKIIPNRWIPAVMNGKKVNVEYVQAVRFMLF